MNAIAAAMLIICGAVLGTWTFQTPGDQIFAGLATGACVGLGLTKWFKEDR
jgi:hypothetical protein